MSNEVLSWRYSTLNEACMKGKIDTLVSERRRGRREVGEEGGRRRRREKERREKSSYWQICCVALSIGCP